MSSPHHVGRCFLSPRIHAGTCSSLCSIDTDTYHTEFTDFFSIVDLVSIMPFYAMSLARLCM